jgi:hypothetical protein
VWTFLITLYAGLGSVSAVRWYWRRVTPHAEFAAIVVSSLLAMILKITSVSAWASILIVALGSLAAWVPVALWGPQNDPAVVDRFMARVGGPAPRVVPRMLAGFVALFGSLFGVGHLLVGSAGLGALLLAAAAAGMAVILWRPQPR